MTPKGAWIAASAFGFLASMPQVMAERAVNDKAAGLLCEGINACKGTGACASGGHACGGQNACKGQGLTMVKTKEECTAKGGTLAEAKKDEAKKPDSAKDAHKKPDAKKPAK